MSKLLQLLVDFDLFEAVFAHIRSRRDLLSLALSCRMLKEFIIPQLLFSRVCFRTESDSSDWIDNTTNSLRYLLTGSDTTYYDAVRCIEASGLPDVCGDDLQRMRNLHTIILYSAHSVRGLSSSSLAPTRLRYLKIEHCIIHALEHLQDLSNLHGLSLGLHGGAYWLTLDSPLGKILFNSRATLKALSLEGIAWQLPPSRAHSALDHGDLVWPHVRELYLRVVRSAGSLPLNLALAFPSTRHFYLPSTRADYISDIHDSLFVSRLESLRGKWSEIKFATDAGATLRRAMVCLGDTDYTIPFKSYLVPSLESLTLKSKRSIRQYPLKQLSSITPKLTFLRVRFVATSFLSFAETLEWALSSVSRLSLKYIHISCSLFGAFKQHGRTNTPDAKIESCAKSTAEKASTLFPSLRALCVQWSNGRVDWHRNANEHGVAGLCRVSMADGMADEIYYDRGETEDFIPWAVDMRY
ncbi:hypothetical protein BOTBODRAFT_41561 [Botryobasidium botryosum FD-172 SS1]|uniref:Uncharacterized protein n=1 Tax=Botryobasidium botryosum (strain FD-172 SS1) TaxID=930990 RepID=A0A067MUK5_BOTB1|nr:hypothetical protein BOTBODRAFT_41561 [Botryobasidium botryosum FD-172 SS1]